MPVLSCQEKIRLYELCYKNNAEDTGYEDLLKEYQDCLSKHK